MTAEKWMSDFRDLVGGEFQDIAPGMYDVFYQEIFEHDCDASVWKMINRERMHTSLPDMRT